MCTAAVLPLLSLALGIFSEGRLCAVGGRNRFAILACYRLFGSLRTVVRLHAKPSFVMAER